MPKDGKDRLFDGLVERAIVPRGFRPQTDEDVEAMLDGIGHVEVEQDKLQRMIDKIDGNTPMSWEVRDNDSASSLVPDSNEARELAEMYRARGEEIPPELEERIREMEKRASEPPDEDADEQAE